jgi:hypothetical protein
LELTLTVTERERHALRAWLGKVSDQDAAETANRPEITAGDFSYVIYPLYQALKA